MKPYKIFQGDNRLVLPTMKPQSVQTVITSPPYYDLRDYGHDDQIGREQTIDEYITQLVAKVFTPIHSILRDDGTLWVNLGDGYSDGKDGLPAKCLQGVPWRFAFAMMAAGWILRNDIIWNKTTAMPEGVADRCTKSHEYLFLFTKGQKYFYDNHAIREKSTLEATPDQYEEIKASRLGKTHDGDELVAGRNQVNYCPPDGRNKRSVWSVPGESYKGAHFAVYPSKLIIPCIKAGTSEMGCCVVCATPFERIIHTEKKATRKPRTTAKGQNMSGPYAAQVAFDPERHVSSHRTIGWKPGCKCGDIKKPKPCVVLDPFHGSGTTVATAVRLGRRAIGIELNPEYIKLSEERIAKALIRKGFGLQ